MSGTSKYTKKDLKEALYYYENYELLGDVIPQIAGLAIHLGRCVNTIKNWSKVEGNEAFLTVVRKIDTNQERCLINGSLKGDLNPTISKLILNNHGYSDKQEIQQEIKTTGYVVQTEPLSISQWETMGKSALDNINKAQEKLFSKEDE